MLIEPPKKMSIYVKVSKFNGNPVSEKNLSAWTNLRCFSGNGDCENVVTNKKYVDGEIILPEAQGTDESGRHNVNNDGDDEEFSEATKQPENSEAYVIQNHHDSEILRSSVLPITPAAISRLTFGENPFPNFSSSSNSNNYVPQSISATAGLLVDTEPIKHDVPSSLTREDYLKLSLRADRIIKLVNEKKDLKSIRKIFSADIVDVATLSENDIRHDYFIFLQTIKKQFPNDVKIFADELATEANYEEFKDITASLFSEFWIQVHAIIRDEYLKEKKPKSESLDSKTRGNVSKIEMKTKEKDSGLRQRSSPIQRTTKNPFNSFASEPISTADLAISVEESHFQSQPEDENAEKTNLLHKLRQTMAETFNANSCLHEHRKACGACLCFFWTEKIHNCFFRYCFGKSRTVRCVFKCSACGHKFCSYCSIFLFSLCIFVLATTALFYNMFYFYNYPGWTAWKTMNSYTVIYGEVWKHTRVDVSETVSSHQLWFRTVHNLEVSKQRWKRKLSELKISVDVIFDRFRMEILTNVIFFFEIFRTTAISRHLNQNFSPICD